MEDSLDRLRRVRAEVVSEGRVLSASGHVYPLRPASLEDEEGRHLAALVTGLAATSTLEVGFCLGISSLYILEGLLAAGSPSPRHVTIDPFETEIWDDAGVKLVDRAGLSNLVTVIQEDSRLAMPRLVSEGATFDLAFVDGGHRFEEVFLELYYSLELVRVGGLIVLDDMWLQSTRVAVSYVEKNMGVPIVDDAYPGCFSWRAPGGRMAVLRRPAKLETDNWVDVVPFAQALENPPSNLAAKVAMVISKARRTMKPLLSGRGSKIT